LIQSILFPIPMRFKYNEHPKVLVAILFVYTFIVCSISTYFVMNNHMINNQYATFFTSIFMLSAVVSPLLPVVITVGIFCFDKTGTLTKQGLDFLGVQPVKTTLDSHRLSTTVKNAPSFAELLYALTTYHSVDSMEDRLVDNEVEVRMFTATGWELVEKEGEQPYVKSNVDPGLEARSLSTDTWFSLKLRCAVP
ncbi:Cation-transporting ATPase, partial [Phytophthora palmivora]